MTLPQFEILYHPDDASKDMPKLSGNIKQRMRKAIETKVVYSPDEFGEPLSRTLKGYWKLRVGDYRVIYKTSEKTVTVFRIGHRKEIYQR